MRNGVRKKTSHPHHRPARKQQSGRFFGKKNLLVLFAILGFFPLGSRGGFRPRFGLWPPLHEHSASGATLDLPKASPSLPKTPKEHPKMHRLRYRGCERILPAPPVFSSPQKTGGFPPPKPQNCLEAAAPLMLGGWGVIRDQYIPFSSTIGTWRNQSGS